MSCQCQGEACWHGSTGTLNPETPTRKPCPLPRSCPEPHPVQDPDMAAPEPSNRAANLDSLSLIPRPLPPGACLQNQILGKTTTLTSMVSSRFSAQDAAIRTLTNMVGALTQVRSTWNMHAGGRV